MTLPESLVQNRLEADLARALPGRLSFWRQMVGLAYGPASDPGRKLLQALVRRDYHVALALLRQAAASNTPLVQYVDHGPPKGAADLSGIAIPSGRRIEIEVKGTTTPIASHQVDWGRWVTASGGVHAFAKPARGETLDAFFARFVDDLARLL